MASEKQISGKLNKDEASLWKLLSSRDVSSIQQGIDIASSLGDEVSGILADVKVRTSSGEILRGARFTGVGPSQPYLDFALLGILSNAKDGSKAAEIKAKVKKISVTIPAIPSFRGFCALENLILIIQDDIHLEDLSACDVFPSLVNLTIAGEQKNRYANKKSSLNSLRGLDVPLLQTASLSEIHLLDLGKLGEGGRLEKLDLSKNDKLKNINSLRNSAASLKDLNLYRCSSLDNIDVLQGSKNLIHLDISECNSLKTISGLNGSSSLSSIELAGCKSLLSLEGLEGKSIKTRYVSDYIAKKVFSLRGCSSLESLKYFPELDSDIFKLDLLRVII